MKRGEEEEAWLGARRGVAARIVERISDFIE